MTYYSLLSPFKLIRKQKEGWVEVTAFNKASLLLQAKPVLGLPFQAYKDYSNVALGLKS